MFCSLSGEFLSLGAGYGVEAQEILEQVQDSTLHLAARVTLARCALDAMAARWDIVEFQEEIAALSGFLTGCGSEAMDKSLPRSPGSSAPAGAWQLPPNNPPGL